MGLLERWRRRGSRREYRHMVRKWYADGGDERFRFDYPLTPDSVVLDVGGYRGQWASDLYARYRCRIAVFEPVRSFAEAIRARFAHNDDIMVHAFGLGGSSRTETIYLRGAGTSTFRGGRQAEEIRIVDADAWLTEQGLRSVQLLKINIEGGEFELLERLIERGRLSSIDDIQVQFHDVAPESADRMAAIQAKMSATHHPVYQYRFVWENWRRKDEAR